MQKVPRLLQLMADPRIAALYGAARPGFVFDARGALLLVNGASLALLRAESRAEAAAAIAAERGPFAGALRAALDAAPDAEPALHGLPLKIGQARRPVPFAAQGIEIAGLGRVVLLTAAEPNGGVPQPAVAAAALIDGEEEACVILRGDGTPLHANKSAARLLGGADTLNDVVPGAHRAVVQARMEGSAELQFGALRLVIRRFAAERGPMLLAVLAAPVRAEPEAAEEIKPEKPAAIQAAAEEKVEAENVEAGKAREASVTEPPAAAPGKPEPPTPEKPAPRAPGRFVWQTDADGRFTSVSPELAAVVGDAQAALAGLDWPGAAEKFGLAGIEAVAKASARRDTWSGVTVLWPLADGARARPVDLAALPVFDRERRFLGYRGFGVFRDPVPHARPPKQEREKPEPPVFAEKPENVVPLHRTPSGAEAPRPTLTQGERHAFREIAKAIGERVQRVEAPASRDAAPPAAARPAGNGERAVLDRLPIGVAVHRNGRVLYANRTLLDWVGLPGAERLEAEGGIERLFAGPFAFDADDPGEGARPIAIRGRGGEPIPVEARLVSAPWDGETALVYVLRRAGSGIDERMEAGELALRDAEAIAREMRAILDTATDGVAILDRAGTVLGMNRSAEALFGFDSGEIEGRHFTALFAPESHRAAVDYLDGLASNGVASVLNDGREVIGRVREGGLIPLFMTLGRVAESGEKFCAVFRDITQWKRAEEELVHARRQAERANSAKSDFLAKISHEIRTPLNAIIGFAEVMMEERFGPVGNERYREYLKDIHTSGGHLISLINDLLDLSKIEAGKLDLNFSSVDLNEIASQSIALMQPQANRERIIIRAALAPNLPPVVADARSIRQIALNLLSNSIRFTPPGGQVIVSTTLTDAGEVHLRVRDTGIGMSEAEIRTALEPFRQIATAGRGKESGTGLGLPLTKALVEANRASFSIKSTVNAGTLVEIAFPSTRVLAE